VGGPCATWGVGSGERASGACGGATAGEDGDGRTRASWGIWRMSWRACGGATVGEVGDRADPTRVAGGAGAFFLVGGAVLCGARAPSRCVRTAPCIWASGR
jgi:hypothetical protein